MVETDIKIYPAEISESPRVWSSEGAFVSSSFVPRKYGLDESLGQHTVELGKDASCAESVDYTLFYSYSYS